MNEIIAFGMYLTGHDEDSIIQMYADWVRSPKYNKWDDIENRLENERKKLAKKYKHETI